MGDDILSNSTKKGVGVLQINRGGQAYEVLRVMARNGCVTYFALYSVKTLFYLVRTNTSFARESVKPDSLLVRATRVNEYQ